MWRAQIVEKIIEGRVVVTIPDLYGMDPVGPMQSAVDADVGEQVIVADLAPGAKVHDWWVVGYASQIGRWGTPYPHTHPIGQVDGLPAALDSKADDAETGQAILGLTSVIDTKASKTELTDGLALKASTADLELKANTADVSLNYVTKTSYNAGMSAKMDNPPGFVNCSLNALADDSTQSGTGFLKIRRTPFGFQLYAGRLRTVGAPAIDGVIATVPAAFIPDYDVAFSVSIQAPSTPFAGSEMPLKLKAGTGQIVSINARPASAEYVTFNNVMLYYTINDGEAP